MAVIMNKCEVIWKPVSAIRILEIFIGVFITVLRVLLSGLEILNIDFSFSCILYTNKTENFFEKNLILIYNEFGFS